MTIEYPRESDIPALHRLWKQSFRDPDALIDHFFRTAFSPGRCRCVRLSDAPVAAAYWFDCRHGGKKIAYLYAVATEDAYRRRGYCHALMEDIHILLKSEGYSGVLLVPGTASLRSLYASMGYAPCCFVTRRTVPASGACRIRRISKDEYVQKRRALVPPGAAEPDDTLWVFFAGFAEFYEGENLLLCATREGNCVHIQELFSQTDALGQIAGTLGAQCCQAVPDGGETALAMYRKLDETEPPAYFRPAMD